MREVPGDMVKYLFPLLMLFVSGLAIADYYDEDELPFVEIKSVNDFAALAKQARENNQVIMLEMSASYCGYCENLEENVIKPMLRSGDYDDNVLIRKLEIDRHYPMNDLGGGRISGAEIAKRYGVFVTPTLIFIDAEGKEISDRILGINTIDLYGGYVDEAINEAYLKLTR